MPISYSTRFAKSGRVAQSNYLGDKWVNEVTEERTTKQVLFQTEDFDKDLTSATVKIYGKKILGINNFGRFIPSEEMLLDEITLDHATRTEGISALEGDVLLDTVRFVFTYTGANNTGLENNGEVSLNKLYTDTRLNHVGYWDGCVRTDNSIDGIDSVRIFFAQCYDKNDIKEQYVSVDIMTTGVFKNEVNVYSTGCTVLRSKKLDISGPKVNG